MKLRTDLPRSALLFATVAALGAAPWGASAQYATSFEPPTFVSGEINGQDSWTTAAPNSPAARIRTVAELESDLTALGMTPGTTVHSGAQALLVSSNAIPASATIRPITGLGAERLVVLDVWTRPLTGGSLGNVFLVMEDSLGASGRAAAFRFGTQFGSTIDYNSNNAWQPTSTIWSSDIWYRLTLTVDYFAKTYDFAIDGTTVNATPIPFFNPNSANFTQVRIFRGANQAGMIVDDLMVSVPEPATIACLLGGMAVLLQRRKKR